MTWREFIFKQTACIVVLVLGSMALDLFGKWTLAQSIERVRMAEIAARCGADT